MEPFGTPGTPPPGLAPSPGDDELEILRSLLDSGDPSAIFESLGEEKQPDAPGDTRVAGHQDLRIQLSNDQRILLQEELCTLLDEYDTAMRQRVDMEEEIRDHYALRSSATHSGTEPGDAQMCSELLMATVDQAHARVSTSIMGSTPLMRVTPIQPLSDAPADLTEDADYTESFLQEYTMREMDFRNILPSALHRGCKVGTAVVRLEWQKRPEEASYWDDDGHQQTDLMEVGGVRAMLIDNAAVKVWPPTILNWQRDYVFVGHESLHTPSSWSRIVAQYGLGQEAVDDVMRQPSDDNPPGEEEMRRQGVEGSELRRRESIQPVSITELWCNMTIPGEVSPRRFQVMLHRPTRRLLWVGRNAHHCGKHPYFPLRYKKIDGFAWGTGVGHEILYQQAADTALWNLSLDSLYAGCYWAVLRRVGSMYNVNTDRPRPGMVIPVDDVEADFKPIKLGGEIPELYSARQDIQYRSRNGTGFGAVMSGQGDPTMKSGAGTGSTLALIEQGSIKIRAIDEGIRVDLEDLYVFILELVSQYAPDGLWFEVTQSENDRAIQRLRYVPKRGRIDRLYRLRAQAPSASSTDEARRNAYSQYWMFANQAMQSITAYVQMALQSDNPVAIPRWMTDTANWLLEITAKVGEYHELPGILDKFPRIPEMTPQDETILQLQQQLQQMQEQMAQLQQVQQPVDPSQAAPEMGAPPMDPMMMGQPMEGMPLQ